MTTKYIYRIFAKNPNIKSCYIGSTNNVLQRMSLHKSHSKDKNIQSSKFIRENGGWDNFNYEILNTILILPGFESQALQLENFYIQKYANTLNIRKSHISYYEYLDKKRLKYANDPLFRERVKYAASIRYKKCQSNINRCKK